jgi:hypothetical protein
MYLPPPPPPNKEHVQIKWETVFVVQTLIAKVITSQDIAWFIELEV